MKTKLRIRFEQNLARVSTLVGFYTNELAGEGQGRRPVGSTDILRAAVVFLHATLEDFLRSLASWKLPLTGAEVLNDIPLVGEERTNKFTLGRLAGFRDKTIQEVLTQSVEKYLEQSNYNNTNDISSLLRNVGITVENVNGSFNQLSQLMNRRHQIVHRADRDETPGQGHHRAKSISRKTVNNWIYAVNDFVSAVLDEIPDDEN